MQTILPFFILLVGIAILIVLIVRKFPQLSLIDVDALPEVKEEKKKDEYLKKRVKQRAATQQKKRMESLQKVVDWFKQLQLTFRKYVGQVERTVLKQKTKKTVTEPPQKKEERAEEAGDLLREGEKQLDLGNIESAEEKFIAAIRLEPKNVEAYYGLLQVYEEQQQWEEAEQTGKYLLQLDPDHDQAYVRMAHIAEEKGDIEGAIQYYEQSVLISDLFPQRFDKLAQLLKQVEQYETGIEAAKQALAQAPENPKYLDNLLDLAILAADKSLAKQTYEKLRMVNPDNGKLPRFKQRIDDLS